MRRVRLSGDGSVGTGAQRGTLTIFGGPMGPAGATVAEDSLRHYERDLGAFQQGDALAVSGSGGEISAFGRQQVVAPAPLVLTSPVAPYAISTAQDLTVTWSNGEANAKVVITLGGSVRAVRCEFDAASGSGTIPQAMLSALKGLPGAALFWTQERETSFLAGSLPVELRAIQFSFADASYEYLSASPT